MPGANGSSKWTDALLDSMRDKGDDLADKPVGDVLDRGGVDAVNAIMHTLVRNAQPVPEDLPAEIRAYLANSQPLPEWADMDKIRRGQELYETWGVLITLCLFCASLPASYAAAKGVRVLYLTAQLDTHTRRRVMETGQFLMDVLTVGGLDDEHGKGRRTIQRVRLMHGAVRHLIIERSKRGDSPVRGKPPLWHPDWGKPINQEDLAGTREAFSYIVADSLPKLGVRLPDEDVDAYLHLWNVIGHLMGIDDELLVDGVDDAKALVDAIKRRQFRSSPEGREMTRALLKLLDEMTPLHSFDETIPPLIRHLIGDDVAEMLAIPKWELPELGPLTRVDKWIFGHVFGNTKRDTARYELVSRIARPFGDELVHGLFRLERGGKRASFDIPDHLARYRELSSSTAPVAPALDRLKEPGTIDDVLRNIDQILDWAKEAKNPIGYFAVLYRRVTLGIRDAINDEGFVDGPRIERLDVAFAKRYFNALNAYFYPDESGGLTLPWKVSFVGDQDRQAIILQHMLAGLNAHIRFDLGLALLTVAGDWPDSLREDYDRVNDLLCAQIPGINKKVQELSPELRWLRVLIPDEISEMKKAVTKLREEAWDFATYMARNPGNATEKAVHQEASTSALNSWYLQPSGRFSPFPALVRAVAKHEKPNVRNNLDVLEDISRSPEKTTKARR